MSPPPPANDLLARAKTLREKRAYRAIEIADACRCAWPVRVFNNPHGHSPTCPAVKVIERHAQEDDGR